MSLGHRLMIRIGKIGCACALACAATALSGCVFSDAITEIIYEQDEAWEIDFNAPKIYINSPKAEIVSEQIPSLVPIDEGTRQELENFPHFDGDLQDADVRDSQEGLGDYQEETRTDDSGANWEAGIGDQHDESVQDVPEVVPKQEQPPEEEQQEPEEEAEEEQEPEEEEKGAPISNPDEDKSVARSNPSDTGNTADEGEDAPEPDVEEEPNVPEEPEQAEESNEGTEEPIDEGGGKTDGEEDAGNNGENPEDTSEVGKNPGATFNDVGSLDELPEDVHTVAAVGDAAIITAVVGGADGEPNLVAADETLLGSSAKDVLAGLGIASVQKCWQGDGKKGGALLADLLALEPDAVLIMEGESPLTEQEMTELLEAGTNMVYLPAMTTHENIVQCVQRVGALLDKGGDAKAAVTADEYRTFTNGLITECGTVEETVCSLYVDEWVEGLTYNDPYKRDIPVKAVACAPVGAASFPLSQYLSTAGVQNAANAGRYKSIQSDSASAVVWPLSGGTNDGDWTGITEVNGGLATIDNGYTLSLTRYMNSENRGDYFDLGSPDYPAVVTKDKGLKKSFEDSRDNEGLYSAQTETTDIVSDDYQVYVNPCGMVSPWTVGSMESPLEMAWALDRFHKTASTADAGSLEYAKGVVKDFYEKFYKYSPTADDLLHIVAGDFAS